MLRNHISVNVDSVLTLSLNTFFMLLEKKKNYVQSMITWVDNVNAEPLQTRVLLSQALIWWFNIRYTEIYNCAISTKKYPTFAKAPIQTDLFCYGNQSKQQNEWRS
jgi:hypothetical protein